MSLLSKREYLKKEPFRDAKIYIIICEGEKREPDYFKFFDGLTSQIKMVIVPSSGGRSAPKHLLENARIHQDIIINDGGDYELWFVLDLDRWQDHLHTIHNECRRISEWNLSISNPCFEVWLYYHFTSQKPHAINLEMCSTWRQIIPTVVEGGFNSNHHPTLIMEAINNSRQDYSETGYLPNTGSTQVYRIAEKILRLTEKIILRYKNDN